VKTEAGRYSETSVSNYHITRWKNPGNHELYLHCRDILRYQIRYGINRNSLVKCLRAGRTRFDSRWRQISYLLAVLQRGGWDSFSGNLKLTTHPRAERCVEIYLHARCTSTLKVSEDEMLRRKFRSKKDDIVKNWRKLRDEKSLK